MGRDGFARHQLVRETASIDVCTLGPAGPAPGGQTVCPHAAAGRPD
jgi:hypothetical protein